MKEKPEWIIENELEVRKVYYNNNVITYSVLKKETMNFLGFLGLQEGYFYISEEVPEEFMEPQIIHEFIEFNELKGQRRRCLESLKRELSIVPEDIKKSYIEYRKDFFKRLTEFFEDSDHEDFKEEIGMSYSFLRKLNFKNQSG
ncbi:MAG: hypothetical protein WD607_04440 [Candidatus Paceibacterota bacterium]